ncbi:hypothetical protein EST38_g3508 [Candolleomyces aberdarensis]|uniref:Uncharacterized protein n=1 Tax=Candolleomyces aberdarensis TaxID=2316362 RepID=A0A4Q2DQD1_9AGAR|nr:hypothetical protein EST38_g3508 [Candolleomyces aberdarensis]
MSEDGDESMASDHESSPGHATATIPPESSRSSGMDRYSEIAEPAQMMAGQGGSAQACRTAFNSKTVPNALKTGHGEGNCDLGRRMEDSDGEMVDRSQATENDQIDEDTKGEGGEEEREGGDEEDEGDTDTDADVDTRNGGSVAEREIVDVDEGERGDEEGAEIVMRASSKSLSPIQSDEGEREDEEKAEIVMRTSLNSRSPIRSEAEVEVHENLAQRVAVHKQESGGEVTGVKEDEEEAEIVMRANSLSPIQSEADVDIHENLAQRVTIHGEESDEAMEAEIVMRTHSLSPTHDRHSDFDIKDHGNSVQKTHREMVSRQASTNILSNEGRSHAILRRNEDSTGSVMREGSDGEMVSGQASTNVVSDDEREDSTGSVVRENSDREMVSRQALPDVLSEDGFDDKLQADEASMGSVAQEGSDREMVSRQASTDILSDDGRSNRDDEDLMGSAVRDNSDREMVSRRASPDILSEDGFDDKLQADEASMGSVAQEGSDREMVSRQASTDILSDDGRSNRDDEDLMGSAVWDNSDREMVSRRASPDILSEDGFDDKLQADEASMGSVAQEGSDREMVSRQASTNILSDDGRISSEASANILSDNGRSDATLRHDEDSAGSVMQENSIGSVVKEALGEEMFSSQPSTDVLSANGHDIEVPDVQTEDSCDSEMISRSSSMGRVLSDDGRMSSLLPPASNTPSTIPNNQISGHLSDLSDGDGDSGDEAIVSQALVGMNRTADVSDDDGHPHPHSRNQASGDNLRHDNLDDEPEQTDGKDIRSIDDVEMEMEDVSTLSRRSEVEMDLKSSSLDPILSGRGDSDSAVEMDGGGVEDLESDKEMVDAGSSLDLVLSDRGSDDSPIANPHLRYLMRRVAEGSLGEVVCRTESVCNILTDYDADDEDWEADVGTSSRQGHDNTGDYDMASPTPTATPSRSLSPVAPARSDTRSRRKWKKRTPARMSVRPPSPEGMQHYSDDSDVMVVEDHEGSDRTIEMSDGDGSENEHAAVFVPWSPRSEVLSDHDRSETISEMDENSGSEPEGMSSNNLRLDSKIKRMCRELESRPGPVDRQDLSRALQVIYVVPPPALGRAAPASSQAGPSRNRRTLQGSGDLDNDEDESPSALRRSGRSQKTKKPANIRKERDPERNALAKEVRGYAEVLMGREGNHVGVAPIISVRAARCTEFAEGGRFELGPTVERFELFLDFDSLTSTKVRKHCNQWNKRAADVFAEAFVAAYPAHQARAALVRECFIAHLRQLHNHFNIYNASRAADEARLRTQKKANKEQLRRSRCQRRIETLDSFPQSRVMAKLAKFAKDKLDWKCCSGEDTDDEGEDAITSLPWRAPGIRNFMQTIDRLYLALRFPLNAQASHGNFPKARYNPLSLNPPRQMKDDPYRCDVVPGLPVNFYNPAWLNSLGPMERATVNPADPISLSIPKNVTR